MVVFLAIVGAISFLWGVAWIWIAVGLGAFGIEQSATGGTVLFIGGPVLLGLAAILSASRRAQSLLLSEIAHRLQQIAGQGHGPPKP